MKNKVSEAERWLKISLKRKVSITESTVIAFLIAGFFGMSTVANAGQYFSVNSTDGTNKDNSGATGKDAIAIGKNAIAYGKNGISLGVGANSGKKNEPNKPANQIDNNIAIGTSASAGGVNAISLGYEANSRANNNAIAIGTSASINGNGQSGIAIGANAKVTENRGLALGDSAEAYWRSVSLGANSKAGGYYSVAIGSGSKATHSNSIAIGLEAIAAHNNSVALGVGALTEQGNSVALGANSYANRVEGVKGYDPNAFAESSSTDKEWSSGLGAVSIGNLEGKYWDKKEGKYKTDDTKIKTRQLIGVAAGSENTDAVNVAQLKNVTMRVVGDETRPANGKAAEKLKLSAGILEVKGNADITTKAEANENNVKVSLTLNKDAEINDTTKNSEKVVTTKAVKTYVDAKKFGLQGNDGDTNKVEKTLGSVIKIEGDSTAKTGETNIYVSKKDDNGLKIQLGEILSGISTIKKDDNNSISLSSGEGENKTTTLKVGGKDLTLTRTGDKVKLSGLADGTIEASSTDAITGKQLNDLATKLGITPNGTTFTAPNFNDLKLTKVDGTDGTAPTSIVGALKNTVDKVNEGISFRANKNPNNTDYTKQQLGSKLDIVKAENKITDNTTDYVGDNLITKYTVSNGNGKFEIALKESPKFKDVTVTNTITIKGKDGQNGKDAVLGVDEAGNLTVINGKDGQDGTPSKVLTEANANALSKLKYNVNSSKDKIKEVALNNGLDFTNGTNTTAEIEDNGVVKYNLNSTLSGIDSIGKDENNKITFTSATAGTNTPASAVIKVAGKDLTLTKDENGGNGKDGVSIVGLADRDLTSTKYGVDTNKNRAATEGALKALADTLGLNQPNNGNIGATGPAGKDGLNGTSIVTKVEALRDGTAGSVVYTKTDGTRLQKANDGEYYEADKVTKDGYKIVEADGKKYADIGGGKYKEVDTTTNEIKDGAQEVDNNVVQDPTEPNKVDKSDIVLSTVNADGTTTNPLTLRNIASALGKDTDITSKYGDNKDPSNQDKAIEKAKDLISGADGLINKTTDLDKVVTLKDLQAVAIAGLDFGANTGADIHRTLGTKVSIVGNKTLFEEAENEAKTKVLEEMGINAEPNEGAPNKDEYDGKYATKLEKLNAAIKNKFSDKNLITVTDGADISIRLAERPEFKGVDIVDAANPDSTMKLTPEGTKIVTKISDNGTDKYIITENNKEGTIPTNPTEKANYGLGGLEVKNGNKVSKLNNDEISITDGTDTTKLSKDKVSVSGGADKPTTEITKSSVALKDGANKTYAKLSGDSTNGGKLELKGKDGANSTITLDGENKTATVGGITINGKDDKITGTTEIGKDGDNSLTFASGNGSDKTATLKVGGNDLTFKSVTETIPATNGGAGTTKNLVKISNIATPTDDYDAANKKYVDGKIKETKANIDELNYNVPVEYTDKDGNKVVRKKDGKFYTADDTGKPTDKEVPADKVFVSVKDGDKINSGLGLTSKTPIEDTKEKVNKLLGNKIPETENVKSNDPILNNIATIKDLQALGQAGIDFVGNDGKTLVHRNLGQTLTIKGAGTTDTNFAGADGNINVKGNTVKDALEIELSKRLKNLELAVFEKEDIDKETGNKIKIKTTVDGTGTEIKEFNTDGTVKQGGKSAEYKLDGSKVADGKGNTTETKANGMTVVEETEKDGAKTKKEATYNADGITVKNGDNKVVEIKNNNGNGEINFATTETDGKKVGTGKITGLADLDDKATGDMAANKNYVDSKIKELSDNSPIKYEDENGEKLVKGKDGKIYRPDDIKDKKYVDGKGYVKDPKDTNEKPVDDVKDAKAILDPNVKLDGVKSGIGLDKEAAKKEVADKFINNALNEKDAKNAVNVEDLHEVSKALVDKGMSFGADKGDATHKALGETLKVNGGKNINTEIKGGNIEVNLDDKIILEEVKTGDSTLDTKGLKVSGPTKKALTEDEAKAKGLTEVDRVKAEDDGFEQDDDGNYFYYLPKTGAKYEKDGTSIKGENGKSAEYKLDGATIKNKKGSAVLSPTSLTFNNNDGNSKVKIDGETASMSVGKVNVDGEKATITGLADLNENSHGSSAANKNYVDSKVGNLEEKVTGEIGSASALNAALAALKPLSYDPLRKSQFSAGMGYYKGQTAFALGLNHYTSENTLINGGVSFASGSNINNRRDIMFNLGFTHKFGSKADIDKLPVEYQAGPISSVYVMQEQMQELREHNQKLENENASLKARLDKIEKMLMK